MKNIIKISGLLPYFLVGIMISGYFLLPKYAIAGQSSVTSVDGLALRIGSKADIIGDGFGNNGQAAGGEVVLTGTDKKQQILSWGSSKIRIVIGDVPTRQPITFTVRIPQDGKLVDSIPTEEKVIMSDKPLIGTQYFTNQYKYYLDQDDYFFITGNAFGSNRGTVVNLDLNKELNINEWSDGEIRVFPKQNIENLRLGANRFFLRTADGHESEAFTITFERKIKPQCTSWTYSEWNACSKDGQRVRTVTASLPEGCVGGTPVISQSCTPLCTDESWACDEWSACGAKGNQIRICDKKSICIDGVPRPKTIQSCVYSPLCSEDKWECGNWGQCSLDGVQRRSCRRIFDCADVESDVPDTSRSCGPQPTSISQPQSQQTAVEDMVDRDLIFRTTVKLYCPYPTKGTGGPQGSGTVIDQYGTILTNRHVIEGTIGTCYVGFISGQDDIPEFYQDVVADVKQVSLDKWPAGDMALLKIRNPNRIYSAIDIFKGNSDGLTQGDTILPFGYPDSDIWGDTITYTEGAYNGKGTTVTLTKKNCPKVDRDYTLDVSRYFKTTAPIDHGNSGGGAYQKKTGFYVGIPSLGTSCDENVPSRVNYILSVNAIKNWLNSLGRDYSVSKNNFTNLGNYYSSPISIEQLPLSNVKNENFNKPNTSIYKDRSKRVLLTSKNGTYNVSTPTFFINSDLFSRGYYVYFGIDKRIDPLKKGRYIGSKEFTPQKITKSGTYYFIFKTKGEDGKIGSSVITEYKYKK